MKAPTHIDISDWFDYVIPADSDDDCVDHEGLYLEILDFDCNKPLPVIYSPIRNPENIPNIYLDSSKNDVFSKYYYNDGNRFTNALFMIHN